MYINFVVIPVDTLSLIGEQTSYMSICVGEQLEEEMSLEQLRLKVSFFSITGISSNADLRTVLAFY